MATSLLWIQEEKLRGKLFDLKANVEDSVKLEFVDMPGLHDLNENSVDFLMALSRATNIEFFCSRVVQNEIKFMWPRVRGHIYRKLFFPFIVYLFLFVFYLNVVHEGARDQEDPTLAFV